ncbi:helix-turn-helix transcriptional regulator [Sorangium sp. So ce542]
MLIHTLRQYSAERAAVGANWFVALADQQIGAAIAAMHEDPARRWSLTALAEHAGTSRSVFALKFREKVGTTPMPT